MSLASCGSFPISTWGFSSSLVSDRALGKSSSTCVVCSGASFPPLFMETRSATISFACARSASFENPPVGSGRPPGSWASAATGAARRVAMITAPSIVRWVMGSPPLAEIWP